MSQCLQFVKGRCKSTCKKPVHLQTLSYTVKYFEPLELNLGLIRRTRLNLCVSVLRISTKTPVKEIRDRNVTYLIISMMCKFLLMT